MIAWRGITVNGTVILGHLRSSDPGIHKFFESPVLGSQSLLFFSNSYILITKQ